MSRLRVGDIDINGSDVSIGGRSIVRSDARSAPQGSSSTVLVTSARSIAPGPSSTTASPELPVAALRKFPGRPGVLAGVGALIMAVGVALIAVHGLGDNALAFVAGGGLLSSTGMGLLGMAGLKAWSYRQLREHRRRREELELGGLRNALRGLIRDRERKWTVEALIRALDASERDVVHVLAGMRERGEVVEELDTETGEWFYLPGRNEFEPTGQDLDSRLAMLEGREDR